MDFPRRPYLLSLPPPSRRCALCSAGSSYTMGISPLDAATAAGWAGGGTLLAVCDGGGGGPSGGFCRPLPPAGWWQRLLCWQCHVQPGDQSLPTAAAHRQRAALGILSLLALLVALEHKILLLLPWRQARAFEKHHEASLIPFHIQSPLGQPPRPWHETCKGNL